jgi:type IV secretory pathway VirB10-like protein
MAGTALLGVLTFAFLSLHRTTANGGANPDRANQSIAVAPAPPPPPDILTTEAAGRVLAVPTLPAPTFSQGPALAIVTPQSATAIRPIGGVLNIDTAALGRKAPALVVDLGDGPLVQTTVAGSPSAGGVGAGGPTKSGAGAAGSGAGGPSGLNADEQFAERVGAGEPERSRATLLRNTQQTIPQGAMIPGVLETALNSDLPGYARAVVSRDVRGFDGSTVLVPRGSRVIGQYKSAVSQGQSRAFVIWTRIIRPDGASIQIASSGTDPLGRAGLEGTVDRHFFERFGGAVLLSVINAGVASLARAPSTQVVIGSNTDAAALGASVTSPTAISPTIKVPQGSPIRIFVARDLDFSPVGAAR